MADVVKFYPPNAAENPDNVLEQAVGVYESVLIIGWDKDGEMDCRASINLKDGDLLWLVEKFKAFLLAGVYEGEA